MNSSDADRFLIFSSAGLRAVAIGMTGVMLALHLAVLGMDAWLLGLVIALGLAGNAVGTFLVTFVADRMGRRGTLVALALLMAVGGFLLASSSMPGVVMVAAFFGMVNGMGRDRGAATTIEQALLPLTARDAERTKVFAWYNVTVDAGHALGSLLGGVPALLRVHAGMPVLGSYQLAWMLYGVLCLLAGFLSLRLSTVLELRERPSPVRLSPHSRKVVVRFAALSGVDSLGGGFLTTALIGYWFFQRFGANEVTLAPLFFSMRILNGLSHLAAAALARRFGLVNTMVWTHLPSSLLLMTVPFAPNLPVAIALFLIREALVEMDVPTRQSYLMAVVRNEERTRASGVTNLTRNVCWAVAPAVAGMLMKTLSVSAPLVVGPGLKIAYDLLLLKVFRHVKPLEEQVKRAPGKRYTTAQSIA